MKKRKKAAGRASGAPPGKPGGRSTAPPRASVAPPQSTSPPLPSNAPPATATHRPSSPATPQETTSGVQTRSHHLHFGTFTSEDAARLAALPDLPVNPPTPPTHSSSDATRQPPAGRKPSASTRHMVKPKETTSSATGNSSSSRSAELQPPGSTPSSQPRSSDATQDPSSPRRNSPAPKPTETTNCAISPQGNSSKSPETLPGITRASLRSSSSGAKPPRQHDPSTALRNSPTAMANLTSPQGNSAASRSPQQPPSSGQVLVAKESIPAQGKSPSSGQIWVAKKSSPAQGKSPSSSGKAWVVKGSSPPAVAAIAQDVKTSKTGAGSKSNSASGGKAPPAAPAVKNVQTGSGSKSSSAAGDKGPARYNLRSSQQKSGPPPLGKPATPSTEPKKSSLTSNDDERTVQLYLQFLRKHEKPNAAKVLLSGEPLKLSIPFKKILKSNRSLAHTICNNKERLWNSLLGASRTFLLEQLKDLSSRTNIEGISDEAIQNGLPALELVFKDIPSSICSLLDFLDRTTLTALEDVLEGHLIIVPTEEGRRILHALIAYLIAHHKEGKSWGGDWKPEDWDVENSRTVSLSKDPIQFTDISLPADDFAQLDTSVIPKYLCRRHLNIPLHKKRPRLLFLNVFRDDLRNKSGSLCIEDYRELMASHPFIMPSEARSDLLFALYRFLKTLWNNNQDYDLVFGDKVLGNWSWAIRHGNSRVMKKIFWHGCDRTDNSLPYGPCLSDMVVYQRHALVHIRDHERLIRKMMELELLVSDRSPGCLPRLIRLMLKHKKIVGEVKRRWDIYVGTGAKL